MARLRWGALLVVSMAGIAIQYPIVKYLNGTVDPFVLALFRFAFASVALLPVMLHQKLLRLPQRNDLLLSLFVGVCAVVPTAMIVLGVLHTNTVTAAIIINSSPLLVALLASVLINERMTSTKVAGLVAGFIGVGFVVVNGQNPLQGMSQLYLWGICMLVVGAVASSLSKLYSKQLVRSYGGLYVTFLAAAVGSLALTLLVAVRGTLPALIHTPVSTLGLFFMIGVLGTAIPWTIWNSSLKHLDVHVAASFNLLIPAFVALYSILLFDEALTFWIFVGFVLTGAGIYIVQREETREELTPVSGQ